MEAGKGKCGAVLLETFWVALQFDDLWNSYAITHFRFLHEIPQMVQKTQPQRSRKKFLFCSPEIPLLPPLVSDGIETPNEWLVGDHKTHLEDQASKRSDQIWKNKQWKNTTLEIQDWISQCIMHHYRSRLERETCNMSHSVRNLTAHNTQFNLT